MSSRYGNGSSLTRAEFIAHMDRVDTTLHSIDDRLGSIEDRLERPRRLLLGAAGATVGRVFLVSIGAAAAYVATRFGVPLIF